MKARLALGLLAIMALSAFNLLQVDERTTELIALFATMILGLLGAKPMNWLKNKFGLEDGAALLSIYVMSGIVAAVALAIAGQFVDIVLTVEGVIAFGAIYFSAAQAAYQRLK